MTNEEKQEIINAVLSAIMTNSKTIEQLTPTESLSDDDAIEVSGGRRISYAAFLSAVQVGVQLMLDGYLTGESAVAWFAALENNPANYVDAPNNPVQLHWRQSPIVLLDSMGEDLDGDDDFTAQVGDKWWDPTNSTTKNYIFLKTSTGQDGWPIGSGNVNDVLYVNKRTGRMYLWDGADMSELTMAGTGGVINDLITGGTEIALSAEMGKVLKAAIETLLNSLGEYCFPNGRPTLRWTSAPVLSSPANGSSVNIGEIPDGSSSVTKAISIQGYNLTEALTIAVSGTGLSVSVNSVSANDANNGTTINITYTNPNTGAASTSGTLTISSNEVSATVNLSASKAAPGVSHSITATLTDLTAGSILVNGTSVGSLPGSIQENQSLALILELPSNLYIVDDDNLVITMGGVDIKSTAYNPNTGAISIASVTGDIVITAAGITYESTDLAFHLDCKNRGGQSGHWVDLIGSKDFTLNQVVEADTGMAFDGVHSTAHYIGSLAVGYMTGTIEFVMEPTNSILSTATILFNGYPEGIVACGQNTTGQNPFIGISTAYSANNTQNKLSVPLTGFPAAASLNINSNGRKALVNGEIATVNLQDYYFSVRTGRNGIMTVGCFVDDSGNSPAPKPVQAMTIKAIRVYSSQLTLAQAQHNYKVDKKRFNLS